MLAVQSLRGADGVDDTAAKFLLQQTLKKKKEEEEERRLVEAVEKMKKVAMERKEVEGVEERSGSSSAAPVAPAESVFRIPRRIFETLTRSYVHILSSPHESSAAKAEASSRLAQLLDRERRGGVG